MIVELIPIAERIGINEIKFSLKGSLFRRRMMEEAIIVGAGPCGLAVAIELKKRGIDALILEKGSLTDSIRNYPRRMRFFSTAENIEIGGLPFPTSNVKADRNEAMQYYRKAAEYFSLRFKLFTKVISYKKEGQEFSVKTSHAIYKSKHLIIATGYFQQARKLHIEGENLPHVSAYYDEPYKYSFSKVAIIGGANSAIEAALELYRHNVEVHMIVRKPDFKPTAKYWLVPDIKNRIKEGKIKVHFDSVAEKIQPNKVIVKNTKSNTVASIPADFVFCLIGYLPETEPLTNAGVEVNPETLVPKFDKNTFETNVPKLYLCGTIIAGKKTESVFIENGRDHAVKIARSISGFE